MPPRPHEPGHADEEAGQNGEGQAHHHGSPRAPTSNQGRARGSCRGDEVVRLVLQPAGLAIGQHLSLLEITRPIPRAGLIRRADMM